MEFKGYLQEQKLSQNTIASYQKQIKYFIDWLQAENIASSEVGYNDIMAFVREKRATGNSKKTINQLLGIIRRYFDYLKMGKIIEKNPAIGITIKGETRRLPHDILTNEELASLVRAIPCGCPKSATNQRNKIITGLLIYQGITSGELAKLKPEDINFAKGQITIKAGTKTATRSMELKPCQIAELMEYTTKTRAEILTETGKISEKLIITTGTGHSLQSVLANLIKQLKKQQPKLQNLKQIRASVITNWLKTNNLRQVQYWAGHKYVSSTERYQTGNLEELQKEIEKRHPMQ